MPTPPPFPSAVRRGTARAAVAAAALLPVATGGCGGRPPAAAGPATRPTQLDAAAEAGGQSVVEQLLGRSNAYFLDVYQVEVPFGAVGTNEEFWRRVDEDRLDPGINDLLQKNGLRAGVAANRDWPYFRELIGQHPYAVHNGSAVATGGSGSVDLPVRKNVPSQDIFLVRGLGVPVGRTYDRCDDLFAVEFRPDLRRPGQMVVSLAPVVRSTRTVREFTKKGEEFYYNERTPETRYELNLKAKLEPDRFLVLGLYGNGLGPTSLGTQFLTLDGPVERREQVLVFVPRLTARPAPATTRSAPDIDAGRASEGK